MSEVKDSERNYILANDILVLVTLFPLSTYESRMGIIEMKVPDDGVSSYGYPYFIAVNLKIGVYASLRTEIELEHLVYFVKDAG